jgi:hypothetical protein
MAERIGAKNRKTEGAAKTSSSKRVRQNSIQSTRDTKVPKKANSKRVRENSVQSTRDTSAKKKKPAKSPSRGV